MKTKHEHVNRITLAGVSVTSSTRPKVVLAFSYVTTMTSIQSSLFHTCVSDRCIWYCTRPYGSSVIVVRMWHNPVYLDKGNKLLGILVYTSNNGMERKCEIRFLKIQSCCCFFAMFETSCIHYTPNGAQCFLYLYSLVK